MTPTEVLTLCRDKGVKLDVLPDKRLHYKGAVTPDILSALKEHKPAILTLLSAPSAKPMTRHQIARQCLVQCEPNAAIRARVWQTAEQHERDWQFLIRQHGYPAGWFILCHVDNHLRLNQGQGVSTEELPDGTVTRWEIVGVANE